MVLTESGMLQRGGVDRSRLVTDQTYQSEIVFPRIEQHKKQGVYEEAARVIKSGMENRAFLPILNREGLNTFMQDSPAMQIAVQDIFLLAGKSDFGDIPSLEDFAVISEPYTGVDGKVRSPLPKYIPKHIVPDLQRMQEGYRVFLNENPAFNSPQRPGIIVESGYRSAYYQIGLLIREFSYTDPSVVMKRLMIPGKSQHGNYMQCAVDIMNIGNIRGELPDPTDNKVGFDTTQEFAWLLEHAPEYNFWLPYSPDPENLLKTTDRNGVLIEPWHFQHISEAEHLTKQHRVRELYGARSQVLQQSVSSA